ncbi:hypothetical protein ACFVSW_20075 [Neobacillus sp. NPDC058068]|uniref:hypothetical protein n=1 Tax=Neobacillus sp. NPDC058068 TaxID=3346325 RepID=UPI0036DDE4E2
MYLVLFRNMVFGGYNCSKVSSLDEAREIIKNLYEKGIRDVVLTQEVPVEIDVSVKF